MHVTPLWPSWGHFTPVGEGQLRPWRRSVNELQQHTAELGQMDFLCVSDLLYSHEHWSGLYMP